jgi:hypothetical protein
MKNDPSAQLREANEDYEAFIHDRTADLSVKPEFAAADLGVRAGLMNIPKDQLPPLDKIYDFSLVRSVNAELDASHWKPTP